MLVRYALGRSTTLEPLPATIAGRFNLWLGREERAGRTYTEAQRAWLFAIRDFIAVNVDITPEDLMDAPDFAAAGRPRPRARPVRRPPPPAARRITAGAHRMSPTLSLGTGDGVDARQDLGVAAGWAWAPGWDFRAYRGGTPRDAADPANSMPRVPRGSASDVSGYTRSHVQRGARSLFYGDSRIRQHGSSGGISFSWRASVGYWL